jgi:hypothetical protein
MLCELKIVSMFEIFIGSHERFVSFPRGMVHEVTLGYHPNFLLTITADMRSDDLAFARMILVSTVRLAKTTFDFGKPHTQPQIRSPALFLHAGLDAAAKQPGKPIPAKDTDTQVQQLPKQEPDRETSTSGVEFSHTALE